MSFICPQRNKPCIAGCPYPEQCPEPAAVKATTAEMIQYVREYAPADRGWALAHMVADRLEQEMRRLDFIQEHKDAYFRALNTHALSISAVELFTIPSQHVRGNTVREVIDKAMEITKEKERAGSHGYQRHGE